MVVDRGTKLFAECMTQTFIKFPDGEFSHIIILAHFPLNPDGDEFREGIIQPVEWEIHDITSDHDKTVAQMRVNYYRNRFENVQVRGCSAGSLLRSPLSTTV